MIPKTYDCVLKRSTRRFRRKLEMVSSNRVSVEASYPGERHGVELSLGALRELMTGEGICAAIHWYSPALPGALAVAEIDLDAGLDGDRS